MPSQFAAMQTDDAVAARRWGAFALRLLAAMADDCPCPETRAYAQRSLEAQLVSLRQLLLMPDLPRELHIELVDVLRTFHDA